MLRLLKSFHKDERGATAIEYGLIISLIFLAMAGALANVADTTVNMWNNVSSEVKKNT